MLRKILMTTVAATAMAGSAYAADLPSRRAPPVAYVPPIPIFTWTGFYVGVNAGGAFRANNNNAYNNAIFFDRFLVYGTGGVAFGSTNLPTTAVATVAGIPGFFTTNNGNNTRVRYALGAGVEYAFLNNWSVKVEYLFTDLGRNNRTYLLGTGPGFTVTGREQNHIVRAGLNYKFDWGYGAAPVVARY